MKNTGFKCLMSRRFYKQLHIKLIFGILLSLILVFTGVYTKLKSRKYVAYKENMTSDVIFPENSKMIIRSYLANDYVLDVSGWSMSNNASISYYEFQCTENQLWLVEKIEKGYIIRSSHSKKVLAVNMENSSVVQQDFTGKENQIWIISGTLNSARIMNLAVHQNLAPVVKNINGVNMDILGTDSYSESKLQLWNFQSLYKLQKETVSCDCPKLFERIKNLIETDYPGYNDKVNVNTKRDYLQLCELSAEKAKKTKNSASCFKIIDNYLSFFKDGHIQFWMPDVSEYVTFVATNQIRQFYAGSESVKMDENDVRNYLDRNKGKLSPIEGIWESREEKSRYAIIRDPSNMQDFIGFVLKADSLYWMPGQVKINFIKQKDNLFTVYCYRKNHTIADGLRRNLDYLGMQKWIAGWIKQYPATVNVKQLPKKANFIKNNEFQLKNLDDSTLFSLCQILLKKI